MIEHIDKSDHTWVGKTSRGQWNIKRLRLSNPDNVQRRKDYLSFRKIISQLLCCLDKQRVAQSNGANNQEEIINLEEQIACLQRKITNRLD